MIEMALIASTFGI